MAVKIGNVRGATGPSGATGSIAVSADPGNQALLGSDNYLYANPFPVVSTAGSGIVPATTLSGSPSDFLDGTAHSQTLVTAAPPAARPAPAPPR